MARPEKDRVKAETALHETRAEANEQTATNNSLKEDVPRDPG
jgi:hypothetical protein